MFPLPIKPTVLTARATRRPPTGFRCVTPTTRRGRPPGPGGERQAGPHVHATPAPSARELPSAPAGDPAEDVGTVIMTTSTCATPSRGGSVAGPGAPPPPRH